MTALIGFSCRSRSGSAPITTSRPAIKNHMRIPLLPLLLVLLLMPFSSDYTSSARAADIKLTVSRCMECASAGVSITCDYVFRIHWGDNNLGSCADSQAPFVDQRYNALRPKTQINTPHGMASNYVLVNANAGVDQVKSRIIAGDGSTYTCYVANQQQFTRRCAVTCNVGLSCYGPA